MWCPDGIGLGIAGFGKFRVVGMPKFPLEGMGALSVVRPLAGGKRVVPAPQIIVVVVEYNIIYIIIIVGAVGPRPRYNPLFFTVYSLHDLAKRMVS